MILCWSYWSYDAMVFLLIQVIRWSSVDPTDLVMWGVKSKIKKLELKLCQQKCSPTSGAESTIPGENNTINKNAAPRAAHNHDFVIIITITGWQPHERRMYRLGSRLRLVDMINVLGSVVVLAMPQDSQALGEWPLSIASSLCGSGGTDDEGMKLRLWSNMQRGVIHYGDNLRIYKLTKTLPLFLKERFVPGKNTKVMLEQKPGVIPSLFFRRLFRTFNKPSLRANV